MLLYHVGFSGIWLKQNTLWQFQLDNYELGTLDLVWKETPEALASGKFIWVATISRIPNEKAKNLASHAQLLASSASREAVKSRIPSRYLPFPESRTVFWSNPGSREYPSRPWSNQVVFGKVFSSPVPELSFLPAPYRGWTRAGESRVQDNLHAHAQNEPIKNY